MDTIHNRGKHSPYFNGGSCHGNISLDPEYVWLLLAGISVQDTGD